MDVPLTGVLALPMLQRGPDQAEPYTRDDGPRPLHDARWSWIRRHPATKRPGHLRYLSRITRDDIDRYEALDEGRMGFVQDGQGGTGSTHNSAL